MSRLTTRPGARTAAVTTPAVSRTATGRTRLGAALLVLPLVAALAACSSSDAEEPGGNQLAADAKAAGLTVNTTPDQDRVTTSESEPSRLDGRRGRVRRADRPGT